MTTISKRTKLVNILGLIGYLSLLSQWSWSGLLIAHPYLTTVSISPPQGPTPTTQAIVDNPVVSPLAWIFSIVITVLMLIVCVIVALRMPKTIGRKSAQLTHDSAEKAATLVLKHQHKRLTRKARIHLTYRFILAIKISASLIPLVALIFVHDAPLSSTIAWIVGLWCFTWTIALFGVQYLLSKILHIPVDDIW